MAFQLQKFSFKSLQKLSLTDRLKASQDPVVGQILISMLTPTQAAQLFPAYYRRDMPDVSGFMKALPSSVSIAKQQEYERQLQNATSGSASGANFKAGGWRRRYQENMDRERAVVSRKGTVPLPQLSPEQKQNFEALKSSPLAADDPRMKFLSNIDEKKLASVGITKYKENGKEYFKYSAPTVSDEEAKRALASGGNFDQRAGAFLPRLQKDLGITREQAAGILGSLGGETGGLRAIQEKNPVVPVSKGGFGWAQWTGSRRREFEAFAADRGLSITSDEANYQFLIHELKTSENRALNQLKRTSTVDEAARVFTGSEATGIGYLRPRIEHYGSSVSFANRAFNASDQITADYSMSRVEAKRRELTSVLEAGRLQSLAQFTQAELPVPGTPQAQEMFSDGKSIDAVRKKVQSLTGMESSECVALAKAYVGATGSVRDWRRGTSVLEGNLKPGTPIATFLDRQGNPSTQYDGGQGTGIRKNYTTHAAIFMAYERDSNGRITGIRVMEQYRNSGGPREKVYPVNDSFGTRNARNYYSINTTSGKPLGGVSATQVAAVAGKHETPGTASATPLDRSSQPILPGEPAPASAPVPEPSPAAQPTVEPPPPVARPTAEVAAPQPQSAATPKSVGEKYRVDMSKFTAAIRQTEDFKKRTTLPIIGDISNTISDNTIISGFNDDARVKAAGVYLDDKGVMHFKKGMTPEVKQVMADFDTKSFMTKIEEKKREEAKKPEVKPVENKPTPAPQAMATPTPTPEPKKEEKKREEAKKPEVKPVENKPTPAPQAMATPTPTPEPKKEENKDTPTQVKTRAKGGTSRVNTEEIAAYPIGGLKGDNTVVVNKQQQPLFTMNTNETAVMNPETKTVDVIPNQKNGNVPPTQQDQGPIHSMVNEFQSAITELKNSFYQNKPAAITRMPDQPQTDMDSKWINKLNQTTAVPFRNPTAQRAMYRAGGQETGDPTNGWHHSKGNVS